MNRFSIILKNILILLILSPLAILIIILALVVLPFQLAYNAYCLITDGHSRHRLRAQLGKGKDITILARRLDMGIGELRVFQPSYREVHIRKRSGGQRQLWVPDNSTKRLQRRLLNRVLGRLRAHEAATGFESDRSIVHNAMPHVGQAVVIRMDIVNFFPTTKAERIETYFRRIGWNAETAALLTRLTTWNGGLPQGAPTSPRLSNLVNMGLDVRLANVAGRRRGQYTRYADDITFSFPKDYPKRIRGVIQKTGRILKAHSYEMHKRRKLSIRRRHQRQVVTGLCVNDQVALPRELRRSLRAARHRLATGREPTWTRVQLQGWSAFEKMIEQQRSDARGEAEGQ